MSRSGRMTSFLAVSIMIPVLLRDVAALDRDRGAVERIDDLADADPRRLAGEQVCLRHGEAMELDHAVDDVDVGGSNAVRDVHAGEGGDGADELWGVDLRQGHILSTGLRHPLELHGHIRLALDGRTGDLAVALDGMGVAERDEPAGHVRTHDDGGTDSVQWQIDVAQKIRSLDKRELAFLGGRETDGAQKRLCRDLDDPLAGRKLDLAVTDLADHCARHQRRLERVIADKAAEAGREDGVALTLDCSRHDVLDCHCYAVAGLDPFYEDRAGDRIGSAKLFEDLRERVVYVLFGG